MYTDKLEYEDIKKAYEIVKAHVPMTPLVKSLTLNSSERTVYFKLETMQPVKSFKIRGALNNISNRSDEEKKNGVYTVSTGNHGSAVSYAARLLGVKKAVIVVPNNAAAAKVERIKNFGGVPMFLGETYDEARNQSKEAMKDKEMAFIDGGYSDRYTYAGQGTIGIEILEQLENVDSILVPVGSGGMITGIAVAAKSIKPSIKIISVQTEASKALTESIKDNKQYRNYPYGPSVCDALVGGIGERSFAMHKECIDIKINVTEESIIKAFKHMVLEEKIVAEASSAVCIAALMEHSENIPEGNVVCVVSGANIGKDTILELLKK